MVSMKISRGVSLRTKKNAVDLRPVVGAVKKDGGAVNVQDSAAEGVVSSTSLDVIRYTASEMLELRAANAERPEDLPLDLPCLVEVAKLEKNQNAQHNVEESLHNRDDSFAFINQSENRWKRQFGASEGVDKVVRKLTALLNKLTVDKFESLCAKAVELLKTECTNYETLRTIVQLIHEKAMVEMNFGDMYPRLCEVLSDQIPLFEREEVESGIREKISFKRVMLEQCQLEFEKSRVIASELDSAFLDGEPMDADENINELRIKQKQRILGHMKFLGELYIRGMLSSKIITSCIAEFLTDVENPSITNLECLCTLLTVSGKKLDTDDELRYFVKSSSNPVKSWFMQLEKLSSNVELPIRIRFTISALVDLRRNSWIPRRLVEKAQKITDSQDDIISSGMRTQVRSGAARFPASTKETISKKKSTKAMVDTSLPLKGDRYSNISQIVRVSDRFEKLKFISETPMTKDVPHSENAGDQVNEPVESSS